MYLIITRSGTPAADKEQPKFYINNFQGSNNVIGENLKHVSARCGDSDDLFSVKKPKLSASRKELVHRLLDQNDRLLDQNERFFEKITSQNQGLLYSIADESAIIESPQQT